MRAARSGHDLASSHAQVRSQGPTALRIPSSAALLVGDRYFAFVDESAGRYSRHALQVEETGFGSLRVLEGLVAGDKVVGLHGATVMQQGLPLGLVDEIRVHVIPVLLGGGTPLFARLDSAISLERTSALATPAATHLSFRVLR